ncbi:polyunsaturated fatty acid lipoxygenase ALOX15B-like [Betta splendens]|uniref:Polyunsaturated fatty acid lipoxygenase ALOX15B-like n=1 Tax=Betta splendens TaxID=158456 RepID=A0A6P7MMG5_BETSP|nr:polyunsaturated fatty acid lipoxygenase ALOX15B-like [Betta splendens]
MTNYEVIVHTGDCEEAATFNDVFITLVGKAGESECTMLQTDKQPPFAKGKVSRFVVSCPESLGDLIMIKLIKQRFDMNPEVDWFVDQVEVKSPEETYMFPIYCWITVSEEHCFSEGTARIGEDLQVDFLGFPWHTYNPQQELIERKKKYRWRVYKEKLPHCVDAVSFWHVPHDGWISMSEIKRISNFFYEAVTETIELKLSGLGDCKKMWSSYDDISRKLNCKSTDITNYIKKHWRDDDLFAHQFLNGVNPMVIQRCTALPDNFPVTDDMVYLHNRKLADEMKNGNIFLCDYKSLDGLMPNCINGKQQFLMAPLVLLHKTPNDKLMPVAIQLKQTPGNDNPIFVPTDSAYDWLLAKLFVRSADFNEHELNFHLLRTHLLAEVFTVSLERNIPSRHPLFKLLKPHTRYTLLINILAREKLISADGVFTKFTASGGEAMTTILQRSLSSMTYRSLCIRDNIADRGLECLPNFYYRDDGFRLWDIIHRFVEGILNHYYENDNKVSDDPELQNWIREIFEHGFLSQESTGIPEKFCTVDEMVKFVTMVIFTCTAQHSAVNSGQYDYGAWMPNTPTSLQRLPPTEKGHADEDTLLQTMPDMNVTAQGTHVMQLLSKQLSDFVPLGQYKENYFSEDVPKNLIKGFQEQLKTLSDDIKNRNATLKIPYTFLDPGVIENSVAL